MEKPKKAKFVGFWTDEKSRQRLRDRANTTTRGNLSAYLERVALNDIDNQPAPTTYDDQILTKLATTYAGYFAPRLAHSLAESGADQPSLLHDLLHALAEHLARGCSPRDVVICPRREWQPKPYAPGGPQVLAVAEPPEVSAESATAEIADHAAAEQARRGRSGKAAATIPASGQTAHPPSGTKPA